MSVRENEALESQILIDIGVLQRGVKAAIKRALTTVSQLAREWRDRYFPKDTGNLIGKTTIGLEWLGEPSVELKVDTPYASFVEEMEGVNWTNPLTVEHFFERWQEQIVEWLDQELRGELGTINVDLSRLWIEVL